MRPLRCINAFTSIALLCALPAAAQPVGTAFTYQGQLKIAGSPLDDLADFQFTLWDAAGSGNPPSGGSQIGPLVSVVNVDVVDGMFTVSIDFGSNAFDGQARWLQIAVRSPAGSGAYITLAPRQKLSPVPHALVALNAGQWQNSGTAITNTNSGFVGINRTNTVGLEWFGVHAPVNSGYGGMYVTTEGDTAWPFYGYRSNNGQVAWSYLDGGTGDWHLNVDGNKLTVRDEGFVGIRTTTPAYPLHVVSTNTDRAIHGENSSATGAGVRGRASHTTGMNIGIYGETSSSSGTAVLGVAAANSGLTYGGRFTALSAGGIGVDAGGGSIGVAASASSGAGETWGGLFSMHSPDGAGVRGSHDSTSGTGKGVWGSSASPDGVGVYGTNTSNGSSVYGVFGELTNPASTGAGVHGISHYYGVSGQSTGSGGVGVEGRAENGPGVGVSGVGAGFGVMGVQSDSAFSGVGVLGFSDATDSGIGVSGISYSTTGTPRGVEGHVNSAIGYAGYFTGGRNYFQGRVGCGTLNPANPLSVVGGADFSGDVSIGVTGADARLLVRGTAGQDAFRVRVDTASKLVVKDNGGVAIGSNFGTVPANGMRIAGAVGIGADPATFTLVSNGDAAKPGGGSWSVFSDERLKRDIRPMLPGVLDRLLSLHGRTFEYVEDAIENRLGLRGRQTGLIAQEVRKVFPDWVSADDEGFLYVTERGQTAIVVEALRELRAEKDAAIEELRAENDELRRRLERLEAALRR